MQYLIISDACINPNRAQVCTFGLNSQVWKIFNIVHLNFFKDFLFNIGKHYIFYFIFIVYVVMAVTCVYTEVMYFRVYFGFYHKNTERCMEKNAIDSHLTYVLFVCLIVWSLSSLSRISDICTFNDKIHDVIVNLGMTRYTIFYHTCYIWNS